MFVDGRNSLVVVKGSRDLQAGGKIYKGICSRGPWRLVEEESEQLYSFWLPA